MRKDSVLEMRTGFGVAKYDELLLLLALVSVHTLKASSSSCSQPSSVLVSSPYRVDLFVPCVGQQFLCAA